MRDPFWIDPEQPTGISFSGGRTSAYMLWRILQANGGLPENARVCFSNTGKEVEATLRFVRECGARWQVPITWLEYRDDPAGFAVVDFATASREGEPFEAMIRKRLYLPNPVARVCTGRLKIRPTHKFLRQCGWTEWDQCLGIRADEPRRVAKIRARGHSSESTRETMCLPLAEAGVTVRDVGAFWKAQPFELELLTVHGRTLEGNCDLCFLKPRGQRLALIPARAGCVSAVPRRFTMTATSSSQEKSFFDLHLTGSGLIRRVRNVKPKNGAPYTLQQASRRSWRIGQKQPVRVIYLGYAATSQMSCLELMAKKIMVSQSTLGDMPDSGLDVLNQDGDSVEVALARQLVTA